jgi:hypothetical protein
MVVLYHLCYFKVEIEIWPGFYRVFKTKSDWIYDKISQFVLHNLITWTCSTYTVDFFAAPKPNPKTYPYNIYIRLKLNKMSEINRIVNY